MLFKQDQLEFKACTSFDEVFDAIIRLCRHPFVVLECMPALSRHIFCLATPVISQPKTVYAFDLEAMPSDTHTRKAVIALLVRKDIIKVVWDGQHFYQQLQSSLNVAVSPVLDLQLLDVLERVDAENQGSRPRDSCSTTLTSRLLHSINENLTRKSKTVVPLEVCIARYAPDAPTRTFQERFQRPEILLLLKMGSKVEDIAYLMRAFVSSGLLPDVASAEFTDIVTELHFLLERSRRFVTLSRLEDESVAFDAHLFPMLAAAKSSYKPYLNSTIPINAPSLPPLPPIPSTSAAHVTSTSAPTGRVTYTKDGVSELVEYEFCDTSESILSAVNAVSQHRFVLLDCEAKCLGSLAGVLSIISLGIPFQPHEALSQRIFLIDVLALSEISDPRPREAIAQLLTSSATKVVWDGRMDAVELREYFGVTLGPVLDLQIAEVLGRSYVDAESEKERRNRIGRRLGPKILKRKAATQALFANLHVVLAMGKVPTAYKISTPISKQRHVKKELFGDAGCVLERPAPRKLLNYSAGDIRIMAHIFAHFTATDIVPVNTPHFKRFIELSDRYVSRNGLSGRAEPGPLFAGYLLLTDSLTESLAGAAICKACGNLLTPACFEKKGKLRREQCRACVVTALSSRTPKEVARSLRET